MQYHPYDSWSNDEILRAVATKEDPTDLEIALMERMEMLIDEIAELHEIRKKTREIEGVPV